MRFVLVLVVSMLFCSCSPDIDDERFGISEDSFLIFGHFYGECFGEGCVETYMLTDAQLLEDTIDDYSGQQLNFEALDDALYQQVRDLPEFFPLELLNKNDSVIGCPDCADGGGLYIVYSKNGNQQRWRIDQAKGNVPAYLHDFIDQVNARIALINQ